MKKYEIRRNRIEVAWKNRKEIKEGISLTADSQEPEIVESFDTLEDAKASLQKYKSNIRELSGVAGKYYLVEEYYIEENSYDEDEEWVEGGNVLEFSKIAIELVERPSYKTLATFDNMKDAEEACGDYEGENEVYLSFNHNEIDF